MPSDFVRKNSLALCCTCACSTNITLCEIEMKYNQLEWELNKMYLGLGFHNSGGKKVLRSWWKGFSTLSAYTLRML